MWKKWQAFGQKVDWQKEFPDHQIWKDHPVPAGTQPELIKHLFHLPVLDYYIKLIDRKAFGHFPPIGLQEMGGMLASSHQEGIISVADDVTDGRLTLSDDMIETETILRKNSKLYDFLQTEFNEEYTSISKQGIRMMVESLKASTPAPSCSCSISSSCTCSLCWVLSTECAMYCFNP